jgi:SP family facilitated glucose transporter-like MFS transporter 8
MKRKSRLKDLVATRGNRKALYLCLGLVTAQQFCGINAVLFYSQTIFASSGGSLGGAESTIVIGVVMLVSSGITPLVVERVGRRPLLLASAVGMIIGLVRGKSKSSHITTDGQSASPSWCRAPIWSP